MMIAIKTNSGELPDIPKALKRNAVKGAKPPVSVPPSERKLLSPSEAMAVEGRDTRLPKNVEPTGTAILDAAREPKAAKKVKPVKEVKPTREGLVTVASIAEEYGLIPREARGLLRAAKIAKPSVGWAYDAKDAALAKVRDVLKAGKASPKKALAPKGEARAKLATDLAKLPSGGVWSGKAKKTKVAVPPAPKSPKAEARDLAQRIVTRGDVKQRKAEARAMAERAVGVGVAKKAK